MYYQIQKIKNNLVFIKWLKQPYTNNEITHQWVDEIKYLIETAAFPLYFFSDVRLGHVTDIRAIQRLAHLTQHKNYGGGVALGNKLAPSVYIKLESDLGKNDDAMFYSKESAIAALEKFKSGITANINWENLLESKEINARIHFFNVGQIECNVLLDGASIIDNERFMGRFPNGNEAEYRQAYADIGLSYDEADSSFNILVAKIGEETILVDTGMGATNKPDGGYLLDSMNLAGIDPEAITLVIITHAHGDHVLGLLNQDIEPTFPNATYVISKEELLYWLDRIDDTAADQRPILSMVQKKGLRIIEMDEEILPGISAVPIPGHTPGQVALRFESDGEQLIHMADLLHSPMQFAHPEWSARFDDDTSVSVPTRRNMLNHAANENLLCLFYHLTFPGLGMVKATEEGFVWQPQ